MRQTGSFILFAMKLRKLGWIYMLAGTTRGPIVTVSEFKYEMLC
jgi:hypothetical protein